MLAAILLPNNTNILILKSGVAPEGGWGAVVPSSGSGSLPSGKNFVSVGEFLTVNCVIMHRKIPFILLLSHSCQGTQAPVGQILVPSLIEMDSTLNLNTHFEKRFKRASSRQRLLANIRDFEDLTSVKAIYDSMILPTFTYCGILQLKLTSTQAETLSIFHDRCLKIVNELKCIFSCHSFCLKDSIFLR